MNHLSFFNHTGETAQGPSFSLEACPQDFDCSKFRGWKPGNVSQLV